MNLRHIILISLAALLSTGCAPTYKVPTEGVLSKIRYVSETESALLNAGAFIVEDTNCKSKKMIAALYGLMLANNRKDMNMPLGNEFVSSQKTETYIAANTPHIFDFTWADGSIYSQIYSCNKTMIFTPKENRMYEASFTMLSNTECEVKINEIIKNSKGNYTRKSVPDAKLHDVQCNRPM